MSVAIDLGQLMVRVAADQQVTTRPAQPGGLRAGIQAALAAASPGGGCCVAVPEAWLTQGADGARRQEQARHECEDLAGTGPVTWTGQLAAVAALGARQQGDGRYLVCDAGGTGVRAGLLAVLNGSVEILATDAADGGGWQDFDAAIRAAAPGELPGNWAEQAAGQERRASLVLADAAASPGEYGDTRAYRISGPGGETALAAGPVLDAFAPTAERLRATIAAVTGDGRPDAVVLAGGLAWLPLAAREVADAAAASPRVVGPDAAARGALLFARGEARLTPPASRPAVQVLAHCLRNGLLEEASVTLPWTAPFAALPGGLGIDRDELELSVDGQPRTATLPGLVPGPHRVGVRPAWPGPGFLVVRPVAGDGAHVVSLAGLATR